MAKDLILSGRLHRLAPRRTSTDGEPAFAQIARSAQITIQLKEGCMGHGIAYCEIFLFRVAMASLDIVAIGASAGELEALAKLLLQLPSDLPATIVVVLHRP
jgi:chemotaxis response regulator CheB